MAPVIRCRRKAPAKAFVLAPVAQPPPQGGPAGDQLLMGDFERGLTAIESEGNQPLAGTGKPAQQGDYILRGFAGRHDLGKPGAAARVFDAFAELHHGQKSAPYQVLLTDTPEVAQEAVC